MRFRADLPTAALLAFLLAASAPGARAREAARTVAPAGSVDIAICLDTSGSMEQLLESARLKLWDIVNDLALLEPPPRLRVAVLTFGNNSNPSTEGWVKVESGLTEDLDAVSQRLFALETGGGTEFVGRVLRAALEQLEWSDSHDTLRIILVAGNEPADQDRKVSFRDAGAEARRRGIAVDAIYCGRGNHPEAEGWRELAQMGGGRFATIDHQRGTVIVQTPFDKDLADLSAAINETYIPVGPLGQGRRKNMEAQDRNAARLNQASAASRAETKISPLYSSSWDLVDATATGRLTLYDIDPADLPESMQEMTLREREELLAAMAARREEIRQRIAELSARRRQYVAERMKADSLDDSEAFDAAVRRALRDRLEEKGIGPDASR